MAILFLGGIDLTDCDYCATKRSGRIGYKRRGIFEKSKNEEAAPHRQAGRRFLHSAAAQRTERINTLHYVFPPFKLLRKERAVVMENGYRSFAENFLECCSASCARLAYEHQQTDADYLIEVQECDELYKLIEEKLGVDHKLINKFDAVKNKVSALDDLFIYQQGFQDCIYLLGWMGLL